MGRHEEEDIQFLSPDEIVASVVATRRGLSCGPFSHFRWWSVA